MIVKVSSKGQIVLPAEIRKKYGIQLGSELDIVEYAGALYLVPIGDEDPLDELAGMFEGVPGISSEALLEERRRDRDREEEKLRKWGL